MIEWEALLQAATALLLIAVAFCHPRIAQRWGRGGFALLAGGSLVPLLDFLIFYFRSADRIGFLSQTPLFYGLCYGLGLIAVVSLLAGMVFHARVGCFVALLLSAGFLLHLLLGVLTPPGAPLLAPFSAWRPRLPVLPAGHPLPAALLAVLLLLLKALPRFRRLLLPLGSALLAGYVLWGLGQYGSIAFQARGLAGEGKTLYVEPATIWLGDWLVTVADNEVYQVRRHRVHLPEFAPPKTLPRWNNQALALLLLTNPTVNRFYYQVFRHPVLRTEVEGDTYTLIMQELRDQFPLIPGRTLYYQTDADGRNRFYQLQRFN